jgi:AraC-like DNA-binding protein
MMLELTTLKGYAEYRHLLRGRPARQRLLLFRAGTLALSFRGERLLVRGPALVNHSPLADIGILAPAGGEPALGPAYVLTFDGVARDSLVAQAFLLLCPMTGILHMKLSPKEFSLLESVLALMAEPSADADILAVQALLLVKYLSLFRKEESVRRFVENDLVKRYVALVDRDHGSAQTVGVYAERLGVSTRTLDRTFKGATGITPKATLNYRLDLAAKLELLEGRKSVKEISFSLGFSSPEYFHMFFRKRNGITPLEYARRTG